jgi:GDP-mannose 6-dehydrogenase
VKISIFGLGYVGSVSAGCLAELGHEVIGVDVNPIKVDLINSGRSPVIEPQLATLIARGVANERLIATTEADEGVRSSEVSLICVGTPSKNNGGLDLKYVTRVCQDIGRALMNKDSFHVVVVRSTMLPGGLEEHVVPLLESASGKEVGCDFGVCSNPEFLREGTAVKDFLHPPYTLLGVNDDRTRQIVAELYANVEAPLYIVSPKVAEMVKYANNAFHALKVTFANEIGNICKQQGIDSHQVMDIFCQDHKLNLSAYYLKPGFAFGGSCLPKDLRALLYHGRRLDLTLPVLEAILPSNRRQIRRAFDMIRQTGYKKVGVLGFSFKSGTDDLRESPQVELIETLLGKGYHVKIYDKNVSLARLYGSNKDYIERQIPHIAALMSDNIEDLLAESQVIVIGNKDPDFCQVQGKLRPEQIVIDLVRIEQDTAHWGANYQGICWS